MLLIITIILILSTFLPGISTPDELEHAINDANNRDMLAYVSNEDQLMLYDPHDRTETKLLDGVRSFVLGRDGRVAYRNQDQTDHNLYVFDPSTQSLDVITISQNPAAVLYSLAWSPDGHYLALGAYEHEVEHALYVWDGETTTNIMPENGLDTAVTFYADWSYDGRLAFTIQYGWSNLATPAEIYVWDGETTTNLSQNPEAWDGSTSWSKNGQLMFSSYRDAAEGGIYVWDGVSYKDGSPDTDSFIQLAPELEPTYALWLDDGLIGFTSHPDASPSGTKEIILWDLEAQAIVQRYPVSSENAWSSLAEGGQVILSSHLASGVPSYYLDVENTEGEILFSTIVGEFSWSSSGYLAYCRIDKDRGWVLSIWNGDETWDIARVSYRPVQWQNGQQTFSCNNG